MKVPITAPGLLEIVEVVQVGALLRERPDEALGDTVALRLAHIGGCRADAESPDLGLELPRPELRAPVVPQAEAPRAMALPKPPMWARTPRLTGSSGAQRSPFFATVPADDVRGAVVDGPDEPAPALRSRPEPRRVRALEFVRPLGADPAAVAPVSGGDALPPRRQQSVCYRPCKVAQIWPLKGAHFRGRARRPVGVGLGFGGCFQVGPVFLRLHSTEEAQ